jgi:hypothetical protein
MLRKLNKEEIAAVLCGLRLLQREYDLPQDLEDILTNGGEFPEGLSDDGIDRLCEVINLSREG